MSLDAENALFGVEDDCPFCLEEEGKRGGTAAAVCEEHAHLLEDANA